MDFATATLSGFEQPGSLIPSEIEPVTKKVQNKECNVTSLGDLTMKESFNSKLMVNVVFFESRLYQSTHRGTMNGLWELPYCSTWSQDFSTGKQHPSKIVVWIRMSGLSYRYYNKKLLRIIARTLGKVVKAFFGINNVPFCIEYEGLPLICYKSGCYGHLQERCTLERKEPKEARSVGNESRPSPPSIERIMAGQNCFDLDDTIIEELRDFGNANFLGTTKDRGVAGVQGFNDDVRVDQTLNRPQDCGGSVGLKEKVGIWAGGPNGNVRIETSGPSGELAVGLEQNGPKVVERPTTLPITNHRAILVEDNAGYSENTVCMNHVKLKGFKHKKNKALTMKEITKKGHKVCKRVEQKHPTKPV
ncbi:hypothetical protein GOBAR_DD32685 [Gossypium barbadense]|nr:hypothetical protein GOBAR_DD32685 [Gossypium barbadense]